MTRIIRYNVLGSCKSRLKIRRLFFISYIVSLAYICARAETNRDVFADYESASYSRKGNDAKK